MATRMLAFVAVLAALASPQVLAHTTNICLGLDSVNGKLSYYVTHWHGGIGAVGFLRVRKELPGGGYPALNSAADVYSDYAFGASVRNGVVFGDTGGGQAPGNLDVSFLKANGYGCLPFNGGGDGYNNAFWGYAEGFSCCGGDKMRLYAESPTSFAILAMSQPGGDFTCPAGGIGAGVPAGISRPCSLIKAAAQGNYDPSLLPAESGAPGAGCALTCGAQLQSTYVDAIDAAETTITRTWTMVDPCPNGGTTTGDQIISGLCRDECALGFDNCHPSAQCVDQIDGFTCQCPAGYVDNGQSGCSDINECATNNGGCTPNSSCQNLNGGYACNCAPGFYGDGKVACVDYNECGGEGTGHNCHADATCTNSPGSFSCACNAGFHGNGQSCSDDNECAGEGSGNDCHAQATCANTHGSFTCTCNAGWEGPGHGLCTDIDECARSLDNCHDHATCTNNPGSFTCACNAGFSGDGVSCLVDVTIVPYLPVQAVNHIGGNFVTTDNQVHFLVEFGYPVTGLTEAALTHSGSAPYTASLAGTQTAAADAYILTMELACPLTQATLTAAVPANMAGVSPANGAAPAVSQTYQLPGVPVVLSSVPHGSYTFENVIDFIVTYPSLRVTGVTADTLTVSTEGQLDIPEGGVTVARLGPAQFKFTVVLGFGPGTLHVSLAETCDLSPAQVASPAPYSIEFLGQCSSPDECTGGLPGMRVCKHLNADGADATCHDFLRHDDGSILYPMVCPPGTELCDLVEVPEEQPTAVGMCTSCSGVSSGPCKHVNDQQDGTCFDWLDAAAHTCPPGSYNCNECERLTPCDRGTCVDGVEDYACLCEPNWLGKNCDNFDECHTAPCVHGACVDGDGDYSCTCEPGYEGKDCNVETNECDPAPCMHGGACTDLLAAFSCDCSGTGYTGTVCEVETDECADGTHNCLNDGTAVCTNTPGSFSCACITGYAGDGTTTCTEIDECAAGTDNCSDDATCANTDGSFTCTCNAGYSGDGVTCTDDDECVGEGAGNNCHANAACANTPGSFTCTCRPGFSGDGTATCDDNDECAGEGAGNNCHADATCTNNPGSFSCACNAGYSGDGATCADDNECVDGSHNCHADATCTNSPGSFSCACNAGFTGDGLTCADIDECLAAPCGSGYNCVNSPGTYACNDVDECADGSHACDANAACTNTMGSHTCACNAGFVGDGATCADVDECSDNPPCHGLATCTNSPGSFSCACNAGYAGDGITSCADIDECAPNGGHSCTGTGEECVNTVGSHSCVCASGFATQPDGSCADLDECAGEGTGHNCLGDGTATCTNTAGGFTCACIAGYEGDGVASCSDIDDCADVQCLHGGSCVDEVAGFHCICPALSTGDQCEHHVCGDCGGIAPCMHINDGRCEDYLSGTFTCPAGTRRCEDPPAVDCSCAGASSGPCRSIGGVNSNGVCYDVNALGDCPAGTLLCQIPTLEALGVEGDAALLALALSGATTSSLDTVSDAVVAALATAASADAADVTLVSAADTVDGGAVVSLLVVGGSGDTATSVTAAVVSGSLSSDIGNGVLATSVTGEISAAPEPEPEADAGANADGSADGTADAAGVTGAGGAASAGAGVASGGDLAAGAAGQEAGTGAGAAVAAPAGGNMTLIVVGVAVAGVALVAVVVVAVIKARSSASVSNVRTIGVAPKKASGKAAKITPRPKARATGSQKELLRRSGSGTAEAASGAWN